MTLESGTFISDFNVNYPESNAPASGGDNHLRWIKTAVTNTFPNISGAITPTHTVINSSIATVVAATNANTASTLVQRDSSGNFAAGTITAALTGNVTGNVTGNSAGTHTGPVVGDVTGDVVANLVTTPGGNSTNWNTAYGWGNHASAGYLTSFDITTQTDPKYLRSDASDTTTGALTVDNHFKVANPSAVTGQGDNHTHFNYNDTGVNYIRGTTTIVSSPTLDCQYLRADRLYSNNDGSSGYFYNDSGTRTAYTGGDFYIMADVSNCYLYATNTYLGSTSGDTIQFRGNTVTHNGWTADASGHFRMNDNKYFRLGSGSDVEHFWNGSNYYTDINGGAIWYVRDGNSSNANRFTFDIDNGNFTATGNVTAYSDRRLKDDIQLIDNALEKVSQISGNTYTRNDLKGDKRYAGVIAQELETVLPEAVSEADDGTKVVDYNATIALLVQSIKELKTEVDSLQGARQ